MPFLAHLLRAMGIRPTEPGTTTHDVGSRIGYVLFRGEFCETG